MTPPHPLYSVPDDARRVPFTAGEGGTFAVGLLRVRLEPAPGPAPFRHQLTVTAGLPIPPWLDGLRWALRRGDRPTGTTFRTDHLGCGTVVVSSPGRYELVLLSPAGWLLAVRQKNVPPLALQMPEIGAAGYEYRFRAEGECPYTGDPLCRRAAFAVVRDTPARTVVRQVGRTDDRGRGRVRLPADAAADHHVRRIVWPVEEWEFHALEALGDPAAIRLLRRAAAHPGGREHATAALQRRRPRPLAAAEWPGRAVSEVRGDGPPRWTVRAAAPFERPYAVLTFPGREVVLPVGGTTPATPADVGAVRARVQPLETLRGLEWEALLTAAECGPPADRSVLLTLMWERFARRLRRVATSPDPVAVRVLVCDLAALPDVRTVTPRRLVQTLARRVFGRGFDALAPTDRKEFLLNVGLAARAFERQSRPVGGGGTSDPPTTLAAELTTLGDAEDDLLSHVRELEIADIHLLRRFAGQEPDEITALLAGALTREQVNSYLHLLDLQLHR